MTSVIASNVFNVLSRSVEAMTSKDIAVNKDNFDILPMPKGRGFLDTNDTCLLK